jgi:very-short-patch-repair endonuclease
MSGWEADTLGVMPFELPEECRELLAGQGKVIARAQGTGMGLDGETIRNRLRYGYWQKLQRGVYASFTGNPTREARLWAALLRAGPGAVLSHHTAAELHGLLNQPSPVIHITVPYSRNPARCGKIPGVVIHRSESILHTRHPVMSPPRTRVEDTVLDLIQTARTFDEAYDWICRAIGRRRTTAERIRAAMNARMRFRWRRDIELALGDASEGALSLLELRYVRDVERPHGLPRAQRQARIRQQTGNRYLDNLYEEYRVCVEIDGTAAHEADEQWRDKRRDRWNLVKEKTVTLRFGYLDLRNQRAQCATAAEVTELLRDRGPAVGAPCGRAECPVAALPR